MPLYDWKDEATGFEIAVIRSMDEYQVPPKPEELPEGYPLNEKTHWVKMVSKGVQKAYAFSWQGRKGHWILVIGLGAYWCTPLLNYPG